MEDQAGYVTIRTRTPGGSISSGDSTVRDNRSAPSRSQTGLLTSGQYGSSAGDERALPATHDTSRVSYHVKHLSDFAKTLEDSAARAFPNRGRSQRYKKVEALLLHWKSDDLFVLPELEDLEQCLRNDYSFSTEKFSIPSEKPHLKLMMKIAAMVDEHESSDTLLIVYYGGHARIDESRQSTWCAWSAIQTLLEQSLSDVLILLDCCAGAASATFPSGTSITETISASSWDAIAPDPGRYSFTSALIEVLQEWKNRTYSAAMLHAEVLARLKHPRPIMRNGTQFEARATPVHFMMTSNHRAPSIEMTRIVPMDKRPPTPPRELARETATPTGRSGAPEEITSTEPNEDVPHVMISLALEDDQRLDVNAWESWLAAFPGMAKYVKVQGVFKSHSTLLLLSLPVMIWDLLPEDLACNFVAFIRSNNLAIQGGREPSDVEVEVPESSEEEIGSNFSGRPILPWANMYRIGGDNSGTHTSNTHESGREHPDEMYSTHLRRPAALDSMLDYQTDISSGPWGPPQRQQTAPATFPIRMTPGEATMLLNQQHSLTNNDPEDGITNRPPLSRHVVTRLEEYFQEHPKPTLAVKEFLASRHGIETADIDLFFYNKRQQQAVAQRLQSLKIDDYRQEPQKEGVRMILPGHLNSLLEILPLDQIVLVDLRPSSDYERSHVHDSINLRAPASFIKRAPLEMIDRVLADDASRELFNRWSRSQCVVLYDKQVEFPWECPAAEALMEKFKNNGWGGHSFILKGHYREFAVSFDKYIAGTKMSDSAKSYLKSLVGKYPEKRVCVDPERVGIALLNLAQAEYQVKFDEWLKLIESEDRVAPTDLVATVKSERMDGMLKQQKALEDELQRRLPSLYRKALDLQSQPDDGDRDNWDRKAGLVQPLSRALEKMQEAGRAEEDATRKGYPGRDKPLEQPAEDYDLMDSDDDENDAAFQQKKKASSDNASSEKSNDNNINSGNHSNASNSNNRQTRGRGFLNMNLKIIRGGR